MFLLLLPAVVVDVAVNPAASVVGPVGGQARVGVDEVVVVVVVQVGCAGWVVCCTEGGVASKHTLEAQHNPAG